MRSILWMVVLSMGFVLGLATSASAADHRQNIVQTAIAVNSEGPYAGQFDTLIAAVLAADPVVLETLSGNGKFTVFAPTDDAFAALGFDASNIGSLGQETLTQILLYHVARGERLAADVTTSKQIRSLQGTFFYPNKSATITDAVGRTANVIVTDVLASNGVIHAIDQVILPFAP